MAKIDRPEWSFHLVDIREMLSNVYWDIQDMLDEMDVGARWGKLEGLQGIIGSARYDIEEKYKPLTSWWGPKHENEG